MESTNIIRDSSNIREISSSSDIVQNLDKPTLIAGFPGHGLVGSISTGYIIDSLKMHQIAFIESRYINPGVMYVGGKLRHPFRVYANNDGNVCVIVCEAPIMINGVHLVMDEVMNWSLENNIQEVIVLDGIPRSGIPKEGRQSIILHDDGNLKVRNRYDGDKKNIDDDISNKGQGRSNLDNDAVHASINNNFTAYIGGIVGGLLSSCLSYGIPSTAILVPASTGIPDPEGAALLIESLNKIAKNDNLKIDTKELKAQGIKIREQLQKIMHSVNEGKQQESPEDKLMYG